MLRSTILKYCTLRSVVMAGAESCLEYQTPEVKLAATHTGLELWHGLL